MVVQVIGRNKKREKHYIPGKTPNKTYFVSLLASFANSCGVFFLDHGKLKSDMVVSDVLIRYGKLRCDRRKSRGIHVCKVRIHKAMHVQY